VIYGVPGLKVHGKLCLVTRVEKRQKMRYAIVGTGNFNEDTARIYTDHALFTADPRITMEVRQVFRFCESNYSISTYRHLWVSPFNMRTRLRKLIRAEIKHAAQGHDAFIRIKVNNLVDDAVIRDLYAAGQSGVRVDLIVRSMFSLVPGVPGTSETIQAISIVDRFLEHSRIFVFGNGGTPLYFISSADLMTRNIDRRVEVVCPIYDESLQQELATYLDLQWRDTTRARILDAELGNEYREPNPGEARVHAQVDTYRWLHRPCRASGAAAEERPALHSTD
jgi:polyphosphate kinase